VCEFVRGVVNAERIGGKTKLVEAAHCGNSRVKKCTEKVIY
jgi:hypothetical protein